MEKQVMKKTVPIIIRDTREKPEHGYYFLKNENCGGTEEAKLDYGDYQIKGHPDLIVIERKRSLDELSDNLGKHRDRFERELKRMVMAKCKYRYVVIEDYLSSLYKKRNRYSRMHPNSLFGSIIGLELKYRVHFIFAGTREWGRAITRKLLLKAYEYRMEGLV
jgi:ERCC4-type nuclease